MGLLDHDVIVINQKVKLIELTNEYMVRDADGNDIGVIRQEGQSKAKKLLRLVASVDQFMTHTLGVYDVDGTKVLEMVRPRKLVKSRLEISDGHGQPVGSIVQQNAIGKIRFGLHDTAGNEIGMVRGENWRAWDFAIEDGSGKEIGRITKKWEGLLKTSFTTADNYILTIDPGIQGPMRLLVFATAAGVDTALKQDSRGLNAGLSG
jgi:uncharacterized protein YxjI